MRQTLAIAAFFAGVLGVGPAQSINLHQVPADSAWIVHIDLDTFRSTQIGQLVAGEMTAKYAERLAALSELLGSDPTTGIRSMTACGPDGDQDKVVSLVSGTFDRDKLAALLKLSDTYSETQYRGHTLYSWADASNRKPQAGAFAGDDLIVLSPSRSALEGALDVLDGRAPSLGGGSPLSPGSETVEGTFVFAAAEGPSDLAGQTHAAILKNSNLIVFTLSEQAGNLQACLQLESDTEESAAQIENFMRGMLALAALKFKDQPQLRQLVQAGQLARTGKSLAFDFSAPSGMLFDLVKAHIPLDLNWNGGQTGSPARQAEAAQVP